MIIIKKFALGAIIVFYFIAGINHFINPAQYLKIIPPYLPYPITLNYLAGFAEIIFALLIYPAKTRKFAGWAIILMLLAFMPAHIYMIQKAPFILGKYAITPFIAWLRIPLQAVFILWAYWCTKIKLP